MSNYLGYEIKIASDWELRMAPVLGSYIFSTPELTFWKLDDNIIVTENAPCPISKPTTRPITP